MEYCDEYNDHKITHLHGPSASYMWSKCVDMSWILYEHIMNSIELILLKNFKVDLIHLFPFPKKLKIIYTDFISVF